MNVAVRCAAVPARRWDHVYCSARRRRAGFRHNSAQAKQSRSSQSQGRRSTEAIEAVKLTTFLASFTSHRIHKHKYKNNFRSLHSLSESHKVEHTVAVFIRGSTLNSLPDLVHSKLRSYKLKIYTN
jgi:hypothetical protein